MTPPLVGLLTILAMLGLVAIRVPIAVAMIVAASSAYAGLLGFRATLGYFNTGPLYLLSSSNFAIIPMFIFMGVLAARSGFGKAMFAAARSVLGQFPGGLALATIGGGSMFSTLCGSSLVTTATLGRTAVKEMREANYQARFACGTVAAGGGLGVLIPPSIVLMVYAIQTDQNVIKLFAASLLPAGLAVVGQTLVIIALIARNPSVAPRQDGGKWQDRLPDLMGLWPAVLLATGLLFGLFGGVFTPNETAAFGLIGTLLIAVAVYKTTLPELARAFLETAATSGSILLLLIGADLLATVMTVAKVPHLLASWSEVLGLPGIASVLLIVALYLVVGCVMDSISAVLVFVPILFPVVLSLDLSMSQQEIAIWFGIVTLTAAEIGLMTPPIGLNVMLLNQISPDVPQSEIYRGVAPFVLVEFLRLGVIIAFPPVAYLGASWVL